MKVKKILTMAAAALIMAACSSDEIGSVAQKGNGMMPLEIVTDVANQTRAAQITASNLDAFTVDVTGTFKTATGASVVNPVLSVTKSGTQWTYTYNGDNAGPLYWPVEPETTTFSAHTAANGASIDEKDSQTDIVGDFQTVNFDGTTATSTVALTMRHAVAKMEFKARVMEPIVSDLDVSVDIKQVAVRNMKYAGTYARPTAEDTYGVITATDASGNLFTETRGETSFLTKNDDDATIGSLFMVPQTGIAASAFATPDAPGAYLSVLAQIRVIQGELTTVTFPEAGSTSGAAALKYAWIAVPLPAEFTAMQAHKKYVFTLNFCADALGHIDIVQDEPSTVTPGPAEFEPIVLKGRSGNGVSVTVETINDFDEDADVDINKPIVHVSGITLNKATTAMLTGQTETLSVTAVTPEYANDKTYTWKTTDASIATVDAETGEVTAVAAGTVTIYAEANDGSGVKGECTVTVIPQTITWDNTNLFTEDHENERVNQTATYEGITITKNGTWNSCLELYAFDFSPEGERYIASLMVFGNFGDSFTFTAPTGTRFTKIEINNVDGDGINTFGADGDWTKPTDYKIVWSGTAASTVTLGGSGLTYCDNLKSIVFTLELDD